MVVPCALDQEGPAPPEDFASSDVVQAVNFAELRQQTLRLLQHRHWACLTCRADPASLEDTASPHAVEALCFEFPVGRASPADCTTGVAAATGVSCSPGRGDPISPKDTASSDSVKDEHCPIHRRRRFHLFWGVDAPHQQLATPAGQLAWP